MTPVSSSPPLIVQSLIGKKNLHFYLRCLRSLLSHCKENLHLLIHEDGSLKEIDREDTKNQLDDRATFSNSKESRERTLDQLAGRPNCQTIRQNSLWGIEFFDPLFTDPTNPISFYMDADILFVRPFSGLFDSAKAQGGALFLRDTQWDAYCLRPWHLLSFGRRPIIVRGITTAIVCWDKRVIDWEYLEWFLGQFQFHSIPEWVMPTAQAGLASLCRSKVVSPNQLPNLYPDASIEQETFGVHLLGSYREEWIPKVEQYIQEMEPSHELTQVRFLPCQPRGSLGYAFNHGKRWINTRLDRW